MKKLNKENGSSLDSMVIPLLSLVAIAAIVLVVITSMKDSNVSFKVKEISRNYLLQIETKGYLDSESESNLVEELKKIGVENIDLTGTTITRGKYGDNVYLSIKGQYNIKSYKMDGLKLKKENKTVNISEKQCSTGKH